jgi:hypothetical protein
VMIIEQLLLSLETVQLAKIDNFIRAELPRSAEDAIKFGISAPKRRKINLEQALKSRMAQAQCIRHS